VQPVRQVSRARSVFRGRAGHGSNAPCPVLVCSENTASEREYDVQSRPTARPALEEIPI
jgi:hypothetical protein